MDGLQGLFIGALVASLAIAAAWFYRRGDMVGFWCCAFMMVSGTVTLLSPGSN